jgi:type I restriction enzyme S subunit
MRTGITSGSRWFGKLPDNWEERKIQYSARVFSGGTPDRNNFEYWDNGTIPWLSSGEINKGTITTADGLITETALRESSARWASKGTLLMALNGQGKTKGTVALLECDSTINQSLCNISPDKEHFYKYVKYFLESRYSQIRGLVGEDRDGLNLSLVKSIVLPLPPLPIQKAIASYLDKETARIDALIAKKERQIELLQEKRQAIITQAVTKGLNPNAKMKDSGVEWIGEIPEGWEVMKLKWIYRGIGSGNGIPPDDIQEVGKYPVYGGNGIMGYAEKFNSDKEDIIIGRVGAKCGNVYIVSGNKWISDNALVLTIETNNKAYIAQYLEMRNLNELANKNAQPLITGTMVGDQIVIVPPYDEQLGIMTYLGREKQKISNLVNRIVNSISLLREYRSSLITAAVSGQIDVSQEAIK